MLSTFYLLLMMRRSLVLMFCVGVCGNSKKILIPNDWREIVITTTEKRRKNEQLTTWNCFFPVSIFPSCHFALWCYTEKFFHVCDAMMMMMLMLNTQTLKFSGKHARLRSWCILRSSLFNRAGIIRLLLLLSGINDGKIMNALMMWIMVCGYGWTTTTTTTTTK